MTFAKIITDLEFQHDLEFTGDAKNPVHVSRWIEQVEEKNSNVDFSALKDALSELAQKEPTVSGEDMKEVFTMLKNRELHPAGKFDSQGRFYLRDNELVDVRTPSAKYPFSQMNAGRTAKFVKAIANKYKPDTKQELIDLFSKGN